MPYSMKGGKTVKKKYKKVGKKKKTTKKKKQWKSLKITTIGMKNPLQDLQHSELCV